MATRSKPLTDKEVADLIRFYESLVGSAGFLSPSVQYLVQQTLKLLREVEAGYLVK